jgi:transcriptional regulator with XRE-family HTH domain
MVATMQNESPSTFAKSVHAQTQIPPLRAVRIAQGLTLRQAAERAQMTPAHLSRVERGQKQLSVDALGRLADVLGLRDLARLLAPYREAS